MHAKHIPSLLVPNRRQFILGLAAGALIAPRVRAESSTLRIVYYEAFPPICFMQDSRITGILPEMLDKAAEVQGLAVQHQGLPWARAQSMVQKGEADAFCTNPTPERRDYALFTEQPVYVAPIAAFYSADNPRRAEIEQIKARDDLKNFKQGDYNGNGFAEANFKGLDIDWSPNLVNTLTKVGLNRLDLFVGNETVAKYLIKQNNIGGSIKSFPVAIGNQSAFHFGVRKSLSNAQQVIDGFGRAVEALHTDGFAQQVLTKYIG